MPGTISPPPKQPGSKWPGFLINRSGLVIFVVSYSIILIHDDFHLIANNYELTVIYVSLQSIMVVM